MRQIHDHTGLHVNQDDVAQYDSVRHIVWQFRELCQPAGRDGRVGDRVGINPVHSEVHCLERFSPPHRCARISIGRAFKPADYMAKCFAGRVCKNVADFGVCPRLTDRSRKCLLMRRDHFR